MIILVHSETDAGTLAEKLGRAEYSYFFVLRFFRPVLERIGLVIPVADPAREVDRTHAQARARGEDCVFLSFAPPHRTLTTLACPTIPVFAWEFDTIPGEHWGGEPRHDWVAVLRKLGRAIVHSQATVAVIRAALGEDFPVACIPAPVWDHFAPPRDAGVRLRPQRATLSVRGTVIDTAAIDMAGLRHDENWIERIRAERVRRGRVTTVALDGVVYSSVFNPEDGRKNWTDMVGAFCRVFHDTADATLVLKLTHHDGTWGMALMLRHLWRLMPFGCRVVLIHGYLPETDYAKLIAVATYSVNTSHGEGQCLPLMEAMSAGKPAIAPKHTGMADYLNAECAFLVGSTAEPTSWPQDSRHAIRTQRRRIDLGSLEQAYRDSHNLARHDGDCYSAMGLAATEMLRRHCSAETVGGALMSFFDASQSLSNEADNQAEGVSFSALQPLIDGAETKDALGIDPGWAMMEQTPDVHQDLSARIDRLSTHGTARPFNVAEYRAFDPSDRRHAAALLKRYGFSVSASPGNLILLHGNAGRVLSETPVSMFGRDNTLVIDRNCGIHGRIEMTGNGNLAFFQGEQNHLAIGLTMYGGDTLFWGKGASSWGIRIWVQGGTVCRIGEDCLFSENITIRTSDHHSILTLDEFQAVNPPASVTVGKHVWVGQDCAIGKGVTVGDGAIIGLRSTVVGDVGAFELWAGSPARKLRERVSWTLSHPIPSLQDMNQLRQLVEQSLEDLPTPACARV